MLSYLFIITIIYELFDVIRMLYKIRTNSWAPSELEMVPDLSHRLVNLAVASILSMGFVAGAFAGIFAGGTLALWLAAVYAVCAALGTALYGFMFAAGRNLNLFHSIYNFVMMILFIRCIAVGGLL